MCRLYHMPILISVGVTKDADYTLIDASRFEENIVKTYIAMLFNQFGDLFFIRKLGGVAVAPQKINQIVDVGKRAAVDLYGVIKAQMRDFSDIQKDKVKQRHKQLVP
ncbi:3' exoribonuclease family, domain 1 containing protein [Babesia divergens]|uniref:3' exoribonuclease family, domain 1 containing protein n=1 Tax=Babesia divergens TaxID=32595 RepID=A0AAD9GFE9_BABDI|nr:3' exoribonuclease family, domain 1 containing protein [Babesia divergens]